jgi:F-type H+-transporting ATPase subunit a
MMLADFNLIGRITDHPWPGCQVKLWGMTVTLMSSGIASMLLTGVALAAVIIPLARRRRETPTGAANALEALVVFVREMIARPALGERMHPFVPLLLTLFVFVLGMNLLGLVPLESVTSALNLPPMGLGPTAIPTVCLGLASLSLMTILTMGLYNAVRKWRRDHGWPIWLCVPLAPVLWMLLLSPSVPGVTGKLLIVPLGVLEIVGVLSRCAALMIRLLANMLSGHVLAAILAMFVFQAVAGWMESRSAGVFYVPVICIASGVAANILDLLVAAIQAYIFTFLTAIFIGLYGAPSH